MKSHSVEIQVPFHDVDAMEVVWHGHYVKYFEVARCALLESFHCGYIEMRELGHSWPVIGLKLRFAKPAQFGQILRVTATLVEWDVRLGIDYEIHDVKTGERLTTGSTVQVAVNLRTRETCFAVPPEILERLGLLVR